MVSEARKQSIAWMETDYSKHTNFRWKIKWRLKHLGTLGVMGAILALFSIGEFQPSLLLPEISIVNLPKRYGEESIGLFY